MTRQAEDNINLFWFLPTHGDGRYLGTTEGGRPVDLLYLQQVALAADSLGYYGVLILPEELRGQLAGGVGAGAADPASALSGGGAPRPAAADAGGADGGDP